MNTYISCKVTCYNQWRSLEDTFAYDAQSHILNLLSQLQILRKKGIYIHDNIFKAYTFANHLAVVGEPILNCDLLMYALSAFSCNSCYNPFVTLINIMVEKPSFSAFHKQLET